MDENGRRELGLFRYALIRDVADPGCRRPSEAGWSAPPDREHVGPDGRPVRVARGTLDEWIRAYRQGGFEALVPRPRVVAPRTSAEVLELAFHSSASGRSGPRRRSGRSCSPPAAMTGRCRGCGLCRRISRAQGQHPRGRPHPGEGLWPFEAAVRNELGPGTGCTAPRWPAPPRRAVLLAFIDDHSRLLVGWRWGTGEDVFRLEAALRSGLMARRVPEAILVDRGSPFVSSQLLRACAVLGVKLIHASPRAATTKGKIERFFRTVRDQFLVEIDDGVELAELNRLFSAWLEVVYHRRAHSETGHTPLARFQAAGASALPSPALLSEAFCGRWSGRSPRPRRCRCTKPI